MEGGKGCERREAYGEKSGGVGGGTGCEREEKSSELEEGAGRERQRRSKSKLANHEAESAYVTGAGGAG